MIKKPAEMKFTDKNIVLIITGAPGVGKTTLACSAGNPIVIDTDKGMARVKVNHRKDTSEARTYKEIRADIAEAQKAGYDTLVVDTVGSLLDAMKADIIEENPKMAQTDGSLSLKGYGALKSAFLAFSAEVRAKFYNVVFIFHEFAQRDGDNIFYDIICEGSTKQLVWQPADLGGRLFLRDGRRYLAFTPTESYNAKSGYGISGIIEVPELKDGDPNDFLARLFDKVRSNLAAEAEAFAPKEAVYAKAMADGMEVISLVTDPKGVEIALDTFSGMEHALTSEAELKAALKKKMAELHIVWNKKTKAYEFAENNG